MDHARFPILLDRRPLYPEVVATNVPRGTLAKLKARAQAEGTTRADLLRRALDHVLTAPHRPEAA